MVKYKWYACDFETAADEQAELNNKTYVWAWGLSKIQEDCKSLDYYGTNIDTFLETAFELGGTFWFHNEKFDGSFILNRLFEYDFSYTDKGTFDMDNHTFNSIINGMGQVYQITIKQNNKIIKICNSLLKIPKSIRDIAKALKLDVQKGDIDYRIYREEGGELTQEDYDYLQRDVVILARGMYELCMKYENDKLTIGADCMVKFKEFCKDYEKLYNDISLDEDRFIRKAYFGGWVFVNPEYKNRLIYKGATYDKNSMYPGVMHSMSGYLFPYGKPKYFIGEYIDNNEYPLFVQRINVGYAKLKVNRWPTINIGIFAGKIHSEYATEIIEKDLTLTKTDLKWFMLNYDFNENDIHYLDGYMFHATIGTFNSYIDFYMELKIKATKSKNAVERELAKLMLNNLYGKFGTNPIRKSKIPVYINNKLEYMDEKKYWDYRTKCTHDLPSKNLDEYKIQGYIPVAVFTTAYARNELWEAIDKIGYNNFIYADTDSIHILLSALNIAQKNLDIHDSRLGAWKCESIWSQGYFIRAKTYYELIWKIGGRINLNRNDYNIKACGMPDILKGNININNFCEGNMWCTEKYYNELGDKKINKLKQEYNIHIVSEGKLIPKQVQGGIILKDTSFKISK